MTPGLRGLIWMAGGGVIYSVLNALLRSMSLGVGPFQTLALVYSISLLIISVPMIFQNGLAIISPGHATALTLRGLVHWLGVTVWICAVAHISLAETAAIGFTTPLFIAAGGAALLLRERMRWERAVASLVGFGGVLIVLWPRLRGTEPGLYALLMIASAFLFAVSFMLAKRLTHSEHPGVIVVWQSLIVCVCSLPLAFTYWTIPSSAMLVMALGSGILTAAGNYCFTRAFKAADISASQPARFLDLIWASLLGWLIFDDRSAHTTWIGGAIILSSTIWVAYQEKRM